MGSLDMKQMRTRLLALVATLACIGAVRQAPAMEKSWASVQTRAEAAAFRHEYAEAIRLGGLAYRAARSPEEKVRTLLWLGDQWSEYERAPTSQDPEELREMIRHSRARYREAIKTARRVLEPSEELARLEAQAVNNLAASLLEEGRWRDALRQLAQVEEQVAKPERPALEYNYGFALEQAGRPIEAWLHYVRASRVETGGEWALEKLVTLWQTVPAVQTRERLREAVEIAVERSRFERAEALLVWALAHLQDLPLSLHSGILPALVFLVSSGEDPEAALLGQWESRVSGVETILAPEALKRWSELVVLATSKAPLPDPARGTPELAAAWWEPPRDRHSLAELLETLAHRSFRAGDSREAYRRFAWAWRLNPENAESAVYLLSLDPEVGSTLDPTGAWLRAINGTVAAGKIVGQEEARLRLLLGDAWVARGKISGKEEDVHLAQEEGIRQWTAGLDSLEDVDGGPPYLRVQLLEKRGDVFAELGETDRAVEDLLATASLLEASSRRDQAQGVYARLNELPGLSPLDRVLIQQAELGSPTVANGFVPAWGPMDAPVDVVQFLDFECTSCLRVTPALRRIQQTYGNRVRFVSYPLATGDPAAVEWAAASLCAADQGGFWEMQDVISQGQGEGKGERSPEQVARAIGLVMTQFTACLQEGKYRDQVRQNGETAQWAGVSGTPGIFVNGQIVSGALPFNNLDSIIETMLEQSDDSSPGDLQRARIVAVSGEEFHINAGSEIGLFRGMQLEVLDPGTILINPDTGELLSQPEAGVATLEIVRVSEDHAVGRVVGGGQAAVGLPLRFP